MRKKIKILYIVSTLRRCGPTNQLFNIVSNLDKNVFECVVLTLSKESSETLKPIFEKEGIKVKSLELGRVVGVFFGWGKLKRKVKEILPDVVHTQGIRADSYAVRLRDLGIKTVATLRCIPYEDYPMKYGTVIGTIMSKKHIKALMQLNLVVSVSKSINIALKRVELQTDVVHNGCDLSRYNPVTKQKKIELRKRLNIQQDKITFISVGHLSNRKDPLTIIKAFKTTNKRNDYQLLFVGDGEMRKECVDEAKGETNILFIGRVDNVEAYVQASDVFLSASLSEGLPNTVLESLSCGVPTILSDIPQHIEVLEGYLDDYKFFSTKNVDELALILDNLSVDEYQKLPTRLIVENNFDSTKMSSRYQAIYKRLLN